MPEVDIQENAGVNGNDQSCGLTSDKHRKENGGIVIETSRHFYSPVRLRTACGLCWQQCACAAR
jgi:hypothetical protein